MSEQKMSRRTFVAGNNRRRRILLFINEFKEARDYSPNIREICEAVGVQSSSVAAYHIRELQGEGLLDYVPMQARTIHLTKLGKDLIKNLLLARRVEDKEEQQWLEQDVKTVLGFAGA